MQRLRDPYVPRIIWIDAICITQADVQERATQVQLWAMIYLYASRVVVWLGEEAHGSSRVMATMEQTANKTWRRYRSGVSRHNEAEDHSFDELMVISLNALLEHSWFHRIWVTPCPYITIRPPAHL
jgi:hypothetical protein